MNIGTKSLLYGYHAFFFHPFMLALAWWRLYGFPWDPRLWVAFFVHDLGYWGKPNMDGDEGEAHPRLGALIMHRLFDGRCKQCDGTGTCYECAPDGRSSYWFDFTLFHSRFLAQEWGMPYSRLCVADKYVILFLPTWLQIFLCRLTGELTEYRLGKNGRTSGAGMTDRQWVEAMKIKIRSWLATNERQLWLKINRRQITDAVFAPLEKRP